MAKDKAAHAREIGMKPGETRNPAGSSNKIRVRKSKLRTLETALRELEPTALANIKASVEGAEVPAEQLASSKWICNSLVTVSKASLSEEVTTTKLRIDLIEVNEPESGEQSPKEIDGELPKKRLSLVYTADVDEQEYE